MRTKIEIATCFAKREELDHYKKFFLVGIGGAGMSGIARMLKNRGFDVRGSDSSDSDELSRLKSEGFDIVNCHKTGSLLPNEALVLTDAIDLNTSPEVGDANTIGNKIFRRSQVLGWVLRDKKVIAVTGTHGKTTTTGLIASALISANQNPTVVVGAHVTSLGGSVVEGNGQWAVVESCEAYDSLRDIDPFHIVLTNLEPDHLDFHLNWENLKKSVLDFVNKMPLEGKLVYCEDDLGASELASGMPQSVPYSLKNLHKLDISLSGNHNRLNAEAAYQICKLLQLDMALASEGIAQFGGAERRLQVLYDQEITVVDDYAHHPKEVNASIQALREKFPNRRLLVVFQPHLYSRTQEFLSEFAHELSAADILVMTDIYPAREAPIAGISSARIAEQATCLTWYVPQRHLLPREVNALIEPGDIVVGMGAGNIGDFAPSLIEERANDRSKKVMVAVGGDSAEREVSFHSGKAICAALIARGYAAELFDLSETLLSGKALANLTGPGRPGKVFLAVHGNRAEDGAIQGLLELLHIPYTGSGIASSALAMNKEATKKLLIQAGLPVPVGKLVNSVQQYFDDPLEGHRFIVKPNAQGSTIGLSFIETVEELPEAIAKALRYDTEVLVEQWVVGMEISVPVLNGQVLPAVEIVPASGKYDFNMKYTTGATNEICPARIDPEMAALVSEYALKAHLILGCSGATRTDMIISHTGPVILEVNTLPGMTPTSLLPKSAATAGISFEELCVQILNNG